MLLEQYIEVVFSLQRVSCRKKCKKLRNTSFIGKQYYRGFSFKNNVQLSQIGGLLSELRKFFLKSFFEKYFRATASAELDTYILEATLRN